MAKVAPSVDQNTPLWWPPLRRNHETEKQASAAELAVACTSPDPGFGLVGVDPVGHSARDRRKGAQHAQTDQAPRRSRLAKTHEVQHPGARPQADRELDEDWVHRMTKVGAAQKSADRSGLDELLRHCANPADHVVELFGTLCRVDESGSHRTESVHGGATSFDRQRTGRLHRVVSFVPQERRAA